MSNNTNADKNMRETRSKKGHHEGIPSPSRFEDKGQANKTNERPSASAEKGISHAYGQEDASQAEKHATQSKKRIF